MTNLKLNRPLCFLDLETTGVNVASDRIVEIAIMKLHPNGDRDSKCMKINPERPIPAESTTFHHITDEMVKDCPTFKQAAPMLYAFIEGCDLAGYNSNKFDVPMLAEEFLRAGIEFDISNRKLVDVQNIFHKMEQRTLSAAYKFYCGKELVNAHTAEADTNATYEILEAQVQKYDNLQPDVNFLSEFSQNHRAVDLMGRIVLNDKNIPCFNFGKYNGKEVVWVFEKEPSYYAWMMDGDFPLYTKKVITKIRLEMRKK